MTAGIPVVTIDGTAGSGKSSVAQRVAEALGYHLLSSGMIYRAMTLSCLRAGVPADDARAVVAHLREKFQLRFEERGGRIVPRMNGEDVAEAIRSVDVTRDASLVARIPEVRELAMPLQRDQVRAPGIVAEGRDMGTVVFPGAPHKFFLTADVAVRAGRRRQDADDRSAGGSLEQVIRDLERRDAIDSTRAVAPLQPAPDAVRMDSTDMTLDQVVAEILRYIRGWGR